MNYRLIILLALPQLGWAQTNISGVVNQYYHVVEVIPAKACVRVDNTAGLSVNDLAVLIQLKGATINTGNTASFGAVTSNNNAGNYELNFICALRGDSVFFFRQLAANYTVSDKVQLVRVPQYAAANVVAPLQAQTWDSTAGKGGVLVISVAETLTLNASISANGAGYRGGTFVVSSGTCLNAPLSANSFHYNPTAAAPQDGAWKGESVTSLSNSFNGGKGAAANGGGGGNNHNNGGAGGANLTNGGNGGGNSSAAGCRTPNAAIGGYALNSSGGTKLFMGGGGGAGHVNNGSTGGGGNGGGIVLIIANQLVSNGHSITANGNNGANAVGDGASGGGAGGSLVLSVNAYADAINLQANGGDGGTEDDQMVAQRCYGEGGGGSGGAVYLKNATPAGTVSVNGGLKGARMNSVSCGALVLGSDGSDGTIVNNYSYTQSTTISTNCGFVLAVQLLSFQAYLKEKEVVTEWMVSDAGNVSFFVVERKRGEENWKEVGSVAPFQNNSSYRVIDKAPTPGTYFYRLKMAEANGRIQYSSVKKITVTGFYQLIAYPNPAVDQITISYPFEAHTALKFYDATGRIVLQKKSGARRSHWQLDVSSLPAGVYYLEVDGIKRKIWVR